MHDLEAEWNRELHASLRFILRIQVHGPSLPGHSKAMRTGKEFAFAVPDVTIAALEVHLGRPLLADGRLWTLAVTGNFSCLDMEQPLSYEDWSTTLHRVTAQQRATLKDEDLSLYPIEY